MKKTTLLVSLAFLLAAANAQVTPTWSDNVAKIVYDNCSSCHHEGGIGPISLMSYDDAVNNAFLIQTQTGAHLMPPWKPDPNYCHFQNERHLSDADINTISSWVAAGTPSGDLSKAPPPPVFNGGSQMVTIDQSIQWPIWTVTTDIDEYRTFVIHSNYAQDVYLNQIEYMPGNGTIVHHMVLFYDEGPTSWILDQNDPQPGYESYGLGPLSPTATIIGAWAPGSGIFELPSNMGIRIPAGSDIGLEIHYSPGAKGLIDSSIVNFKYTTYSDPREVYVDAALNHLDNLIDGPLSIPANTIKSFHEKLKINGGDLSLVSVFPHMHKVGSEIKSWAVSATGDTTKLVSIPKWSFHWQGFYEYQKLIHIKNLSTIWGEATYDNTVNNPDNPNNPPQLVVAGEHTTDEMMIVFYAYLAYQPGDEDIVLDSSAITGIQNPVVNNSLSLKVYPNPAADNVVIGMNLSKKNNLRFELYNVSGTLMNSWNENQVTPGFYSSAFSIKDLSPGLYFLKVNAGEGTAVQKILKE